MSLGVGGCRDLGTLEGVEWVPGIEEIKRAIADG